MKSCSNNIQTSLRNTAHNIAALIPIVLETNVGSAYGYFEKNSICLKMPPISFAGSASAPPTIVKTYPQCPSSIRTIPIIGPRKIPTLVLKAKKLNAFAFVSGVLFSVIMVLTVLACSQHQTLKLAFSRMARILTRRFRKIAPRST